ncbi:hypothetical protein [Hymenobacter volaticus]|uniref:Uncharacterized protein n=1 Tax=Hymenobacter volaticus TaxID=2932254 RepID=A0ABY4GEM8_9BACT|nr:hypothetical protein [Hymenobacter volaticus]UOQ68989.1 hypothetical protein MUN86_26145 [Hymenobacter volaticus]
MTDKLVLLTSRCVPTSSFLPLAMSTGGASSDEGSWYGLGIPVVVGLLVGVPYFLSWATWALLQRAYPHPQVEPLAAILVGCTVTLIGVPLAQSLLGEAWFVPAFVGLPLIGTGVGYGLARRVVDQ